MTKYLCISCHQSAAHHIQHHNIEGNCIMTVNDLIYNGIKEILYYCNCTMWLHYNDILPSYAGMMVPQPYLEQRYDGAPAAASHRQYETARAPKIGMAFAQKYNSKKFYKKPYARKNSTFVKKKYKSGLNCCFAAPRSQKLRRKCW